MKKKLFVIIAILFLVLGFAVKYIIDRSMIFTGYAAKNLASGLFVADRQVDDLEQNDLNFSLVWLSDNEIDYENKIVYSDFFGFGKQTAVYRDGLGVCLLSESDNVDEIKNQGMKLAKAPKEFYDMYWPRGPKVRNTIDKYFDKEKLDKALNACFEKGNTRSVLVAYDTLAFAEQYADGFTKDTKILGWSMTKSIASTMIGILQNENKIDINKSAPIKEWVNDERNKITTRSILNMTSGLNWDEDYGDISEVTQMLYEKTNASEFAINQELQYQPDSFWYYSSGSSNILTEIVKRSFNNDKEYWDFPYNKLFHRISMYNTVMEADASGNYVGSSYTYATTRDWARFGILYQQNGIWFGDTIISPEWVEFTYKPAPNSNGNYGSQFWLNKSKRELSSAPDDIYFADGYQGQRVYIIPSKKLVIVRLGLTTKNDFDYNKMVVDIIKSMK